VLKADASEVARARCPSMTSLYSIACPSVGSTGNPYMCNLVCKDKRQASGSEHGHQCLRYHVCIGRHTLAELDVAEEAGSTTSATPHVMSGMDTPDPPAFLLGERDDQVPSTTLTSPQERGCKLARAPNTMMLSELKFKIDLLHKSQRRTHSVGGSPQAVSNQQPPLDARTGTIPDPPPGLLLPPPGLVSSNGFEEDVPPPPMPTVARAIAGNVHFPPPVASLGSRGHPRNCGKPCKYARRKGGCRNGFQCRDCHHCLWQRSAAEPPIQLIIEVPFGQDSEPPPISTGSEGHPISCGQACKYFRRKGGCRNGESCLDCHQCGWQRRALPKHITKLPSSFKAVNEGKGDVVSGGSGHCPSVGSIGHPFSCSGIGCKYIKKAKGCKDGQCCLRCHLCPWRRS